MNIIKRVVLPLIVLLVCCSISVLAVDVSSVNGIPTVSINDQPDVPFLSNLTFSSGDVVRFTNSGIISHEFIIPSDVSVLVPSYVNLVLSSVVIDVRGTFNNYGSIVRNTGSTTSSRAVTVSSGGVYNQFFGSTVKNVSGSSIFVASGGTLNIYGGSIEGVSYGVYNELGSVVNFINGTVIGGVPFFSLDSIIVDSGTISIDDGIAFVRGNFFDNVSVIITESLEWITQFVDGIVSNPIIFMFILVFAIGTGIGLVKRLV